MAAKLKTFAEPERDERAERHVEKLAQLIRTCYVLHYRRAEERQTGTRSYYGAKHVVKWDGGSDKAGRNFKPIWPKIARAILSWGADPEKFIAAQFNNRGLQTMPYPNMLLSDMAKEAYDKYAKNLEHEIGLSLEIQHNQFLIELEKAQILRRASCAEAGRLILRSPMTSLSALYRYVIAVRVEDAELAAQFRDLAIDQYFYSAAAYDKTWGDFIPEELKQEAAALRAALLDGEDA